METRARFILVGLFLLGLLFAGFAFVYWLNHTGLATRAVYRVQFPQTVSGLRIGGAVLFDGVRVGEVTDLQIDRADPQRVIVTVSVDRGTPIRSDTRVELAFQGLMSGPAVSLNGGSASAAPLQAPPGESPLLVVSDIAASQDFSRAARTVLVRLDKILADNADSLKGTIDNLNTFSGALSRNSGRVDTILAGLEHFVAGDKPKPQPIYDIEAPHDFPPPAAPPRGQLVVPEPSALVVLDTQRIMSRNPNGEFAVYGEGQWTDALPKLLQAKIVQSFENAKCVSAVAKPFEGLNAEFQLLIDIHSFTIEADKMLAEVEYTGKVLASGGKILETKLFRAEAPLSAATPAAGAAALSKAFDETALQLAPWVAGVIQQAPAADNKAQDSLQP